MLKLRRNKKGFTLIELIVVIAILGILAAVLIPQFAGFQDRALRAQVLTDGKQIATAISSLMAEGPLTARTDASAPPLATDPVVAMSGVPTGATSPGRIVSLIYDPNGSFTLVSTVTNRAGTFRFTATRTAEGPITVGQVAVSTP